MKLRSILALVVVSGLVPAVALAQPGSDPKIPHLEKRGKATQMVVDGKPILLLAGELHNSSASSVEYMRPQWPVLAQRNYNTILATVTWEQVEPDEGKFDFSVFDGILQDARKSNLKLVILWFASWKNGQSSYMPMWVKRDPKRFPMAEDKDGKKLLVLSTLGEATCAGDAKAFAAFMRHVREVDPLHTVLMIQVENEVGVLGDSRDRSPAANQAFKAPVPEELMGYLVAHKDALVPEFKAVWEANGSKTAGTWEEVFGPGKPDSIEIPVRTTTPPMDKQEHENVAWRKLYWSSDEFFMAWNYARYLNKVAAAGKAEYPIPMYCNAWLQQPDHAWPGTYPCGGPVPQVLNIWHCAAPSIDILAPDLYLTQHFDEVVKRFTRDGNPLFIPETSASGLNCLRAFVDYNAIGFSPFGISGEGRPGQNDDLAQTYNVLQYIAPEVLECQAKGTIAGLPPGQTQREVKLGNYTLTVSYASGGSINGSSVRTRPGAPVAPPAAQPSAGQPAAAALPQNVFPGALVLMPRPDEYVFVGAGLKVAFQPNAAGSPPARMGYFEESIYANGHWYPGRRLNGDETGNNTRWPSMGQGFGIYRVSVY